MAFALVMAQLGALMQIDGQTAIARGHALKWSTSGLARMAIPKLVGVRCQTGCPPRSARSIVNYPRLYHHHQADYCQQDKNDKGICAHGGRISRKRRSRSGLRGLAA